MPGAHESGLTAAKRRRALALSVVDGACFAAMLGVGESFLGALAVELGHNNNHLALLATVPILAGALAQITCSSPLVAWLGSRKRVVVVGAILQAICHLGFVFIAGTENRLLWPLLLTKILFWITGMVVAPPWNAWIAGLTAGVERARYFAWRSGAIYLALLMAYIGGGLALELGRGRGTLLATFVVLNILGLGFRLLSAFALGLQAEPTGLAVPARRLAARIRGAITNAQWRIALIVAGVMLAVNIAAPFFTPYMLRTLALDYATFVALTSTSILAKAIIFPLYHRITERLGMRVTMQIAGIGVVLMPLCWSVITSVPLLFVVEVVSGAVWAGFEYTSFQLLLQSADDEHRVEFFSVASGINGFGQVAGALLGSQLLTRLALDYRDIFAISAIGRALPILLTVGPALWIAARRPLPRLFVRFISVRSAAGVEQRPIIDAVSTASSETPPGE